MCHISVDLKNIVRFCERLYIFQASFSIDFVLKISPEKDKTTPLILLQKEH